MKIGVLALQGAFKEHLDTLAAIGVEGVAVRLPEDLDQVAGLIIPGGESTTMRKLIDRWGLRGPIMRLAERGAPLFGTCAGMIVLDRDHLAVGDWRTERNAFGRQVHSFEADLDIGDGDEPLRAVFIRAPWLEDPGPDVEVLAEVDGHPVLAREGRILVAAFHPELTDDTRIHELFLNQVREATSVRA